MPAYWIISETPYPQHSGVGGKGREGLRPEENGGHDRRPRKHQEKHKDSESAGREELTDLSYSTLHHLPHPPDVGEPFEISEEINGEGCQKDEGRSEEHTSELQS